MKKNIAPFKNYNNSHDINSINVDFLEQLVRSVVDTTISSVILKPRYDNVPLHWFNATKLILNNNNIERLLKSDTRQKSLYGKSYVGFDMWEGKPIMWVAEYSARNTALRINGMQEFAVRVVRNYSTFTGNTTILTNEVTYTISDATYLFLGGVGAGKIQVADNNNSATRSTSYSFPFDYVSLKTPDYIVEQNKQGTHTHDLGVIPAMEMMNKDVIDEINNMGGKKWSDWYPALDYIPLINKYLDFIAWEMNLDHTRIMGFFSQQDLIKLQQEARAVSDSSDPSATLKEILYNYYMQRISEEKFGNPTGEDTAIRRKLVIKTLGADGSPLDKMNSTFDGSKHFKGLQDIIALIYKICGYSWTNEGYQSSYENVSQTQNTLRNVYETTREKNELFTRQWKKLLSKIYYVIFKNNYGLTISLEEVEDSFDDYVDFQIVSNIITQQNNDWRKNMELYNNKLLSTKRAIRMLWPELTDEEVNEEVELIKRQQYKEETKDNNFNSFNNERPFGSKEFNKKEE